MAKKKQTEKTDNTEAESKTGKAPRAKKAQQMKLPAEGMSRKAIAEIDRAAAKYRAERDTRMEHTKIEKAAKTVLLEVAKKHLAEAAKKDPKGIAKYVFDDEGDEFEVIYIAKSAENVKVKKVDADDDGDDDEE